MAGVIDTDVHCAPAGFDALFPYLDAYWRDYITGGTVRIGPALGGQYPPGAPTTGPTPPATIDALRERVLDRDDAPGLAILTCLSAFDASRNPYYETALTRAINDWLHEHWLTRDDRVRGSITVPTADPEAAAAEIERRAGQSGWARVLLPVRSVDSRYGNRRYFPILRAAAEAGLPVALHAWGRVGNAPTATGFTHTYLEDYVANSQVIVQGQLVSLVLEGAFDRLPDLRVSLLECGFSWLPALLWRLDKDWRGVWREVPWVKERPSEYVYRHFRISTEPAHLPREDERLTQLLEMARASDVLMYASDYPHDHGDGGSRLLDALDAESRTAVLHRNAAAHYGLHV